MIKLELNSKDPNTRIHLSQCATKILKSKKTIVLTGAGISCNAGIPVSIDYINGNLLSNLTINLTFM